MHADDLRALQAPLKEQYRAAPSAAKITLRARGALDAANIACKVEAGLAASDGRGLDEINQLAVALANSLERRLETTQQGKFPEVKTPEKMVALGEAGLVERIKSIGLYRTKAKNVIALSEALIREHGGKIPHDREALKKLPGVGRKTASVCSMSHSTSRRSRSTLMCSESRTVSRSPKARPRSRSRKGSSS